MKLETPLPEVKTFTDYWSPRFIQRQEEVQKTRSWMTNHVTISFSEEPKICLMGDLHIGGDVDYTRIDKEVKYIVDTPNTYVMAFGDLIDGFFFNYAQMEQIEQTPEQIKYIRSLLRLLSDNKKLLVGWRGDHDTWQEKMGSGLYADFPEYTGAYLMRGVGYVTIKVGKKTYKLTGAHRLPGSSMYNKNHPQKRALVFGGAIGSDIVISAHNHQKSYSCEPVTMFGGDSMIVHQIALGNYKFQDDYANKIGFVKQTPTMMYGSSIKLSKNKHRIIYSDDILLE